MKPSLIFLICLFSVPLFAQKQEWIQQVQAGSANFPYGLQVDAHGNSYTMYITSSCWYCGYIKRINKYNPSGELVHSTLVDSGGILAFELATDFRLTSDSNFIIIVNGVGYKGAIKMDPQGNTLWTTFSDFEIPNELRDVAIDKNDNTYLLVDETPEWGVYKTSVAKINTAGELDWVRTYEAPPATTVEPSDFCVDDSGNVYITGLSRQDNQSDNGLATIKYDAEGNLQWANEIDSYESGFYPQITSKDGNVYMFGDATDSSANRFITICYDSDGNTIWSQLYTPYYPGQCIPKKIMCDQLGHVIAIGSYANGVATLTAQYDTTGNLLWSDEYFYIAGRTARCNDADVDSNGNIVLAGYEAADFSDDFNFWVMKYSSVGGHLWSIAYTSNPNVFSKDYIYWVHFDHEGDMIVGGTTDLESSDGSTNGTMSTVAKYIDTVAVISSAPVEISPSVSLSVFPNPATTTLSIHDALQRGEYYITDLMGRKIEELRFSDKMEVDISALSKGIYFLHRIKGYDVVKFIKQ